MKQDVVNAINLDGGGSATFVLDGALASYPSDHWTTWLALTLALVFLLLVSAAANVSFLLGSRAERNRHLDGDYVYHPLQEMNGELLAAEKEPPGDAHGPFKD